MKVSEIVANVLSLTDAKLTKVVYVSAVYSVENLRKFDMMINIHLVDSFSEKLCPYRNFSVDFFDLDEKETIPMSTIRREVSEGMTAAGLPLAVIEPDDFEL